MGYSPVYSSAFIIYTSDTPNTEFLVPAGYTAVIRDVIWCQIAGTGVLYTRITGPGSGSPCNFLTAAATSVDATYQWTGRVVAGPGYLIDFDLDAIGISDNVYVGGYLLKNVID